MNNELLYLSQNDITHVGLKPEQMLELVADVLVEKQAGRSEMPPKLGVHPRPQSFLHAMPGYIEKLDSVGLKLVSYYPDNPARECLTINAMMLVNDAATGLPLAVMDGNWITAYRTAAVSALSCKLLSVTPPESLGIIGYGVQAESHLDLLLAAFDLQEVHVWGRNPERCAAFADKMMKRHNVTITAVDSAEAAVRDKDLVISVISFDTPPEKQLRGAWLKPGSVVCPVEYDSAWDRPTFQQAELFVTDDITQYDQYRHKGFFKDIPTPAYDLADLVGPNAPTRSPQSVAVAVNLGVGIMDIAFAHELYRQARDKRIGTLLPR